MLGSKNKFSILFFNYCKKYPKNILVVDEKTNVEFSYNQSYELIQRINRF